MANILGTYRPGLQQIFLKVLLNSGNYPRKSVVVTPSYSVDWDTVKQLFIKQEVDSEFWMQAVSLHSSAFQVFRECSSE